VGMEDKKLLRVEQSKVRISRNQTIEHEFVFNKKDMVRNSRFTSVKLHSIFKNKKEITYLKIRPHLVNTKTKLNIGRHNCLIKFFEFQSEKNAKFDKCLNWKFID
jgi:hypothetical protein